jgi:4-carboxymuconolactone decarboxylase
MTEANPPRGTLPELDHATDELARLAVVIAVGNEEEIRDAMQRAVRETVNAAWVEELILQTYLFAGFPRALNAAREWRRASGRPAPDTDSDAAATVDEWRQRGEATCALVYGDMYERLRANVRQLHPALDAWMVVEGYGKVLARGGLDLRRRELCIVATCAALDQERQLHSHLHGALHAGATAVQIGAALAIGASGLPEERRRRYQALWERVQGAA